VPNVQNVPLFREKNEYRISAFYGAGEESSCGEIQAAYSPTGSIGLMANFISAGGGSSSGFNSAKGYCLEGAAGYFKPFGNAAVFEIYGGLGGGSQNHKYYSSLSNQSYGTADLSFVKVFIQPSLGMTFNAFDVAFSTRMCSMSFPNINYNSVNSFESFMLHKIDEKGHVFIEPAITLRGGWKSVKFQVQCLISADMTNPEMFIGEEYHISGGVYFTIANRHKPSVTSKTE
jgi:hypothetical protein